MQARNACQDAIPRFERGHIYTIARLSRSPINFQPISEHEPCRFSTTLHASSAWACPCMSPLMGPKRACDADGLPSTQEVCWRPQEAMGPVGGGIQWGRFGRPGHFTKRALGHDQVFARTRFASAKARLLATKSERETEVPWTRLAGPRRPLPGPSGPAKITDARPTVARGPRLTAIGGRRHRRHAAGH
jgi:hypothetical protein